MAIRHITITDGFDDAWYVYDAVYREPDEYEVDLEVVVELEKLIAGPFESEADALTHAESIANGDKIFTL